MLPYNRMYSRYHTAGGTYREFAGVCVQSWGVAGSWRLWSRSPRNSSFSVQWKGWHPVGRWWVAGGGDTRWQGLRRWYRLVSPIPFHLSCNKRQGTLNLCQFVDSFITRLQILLHISNVPAHFTRPIAEWGSREYTNVPTINLKNINNKHADQPAKRRVTRFVAGWPASKYCFCWTAVVGNNSFANTYIQVTLVLRD